LITALSLKLILRLEFRLQMKLVKICGNICYHEQKVSILHQLHLINTLHLLLHHLAKQVKIF